MDEEAIGVNPISTVLSRSPSYLTPLILEAGVCGMIAKSERSPCVWVWPTQLVSGHLSLGGPTMDQPVLGLPLSMKRRRYAVPIFFG